MAAGTDVVRVERPIRRPLDLPHDRELLLRRGQYARVCAGDDHVDGDDAEAGECGRGDQQFLPEHVLFCRCGGGGSDYCGDWKWVVDGYTWGCRVGERSGCYLGDGTVGECVEREDGGGVGVGRRVHEERWCS